MSKNEINPFQDCNYTEILIFNGQNASPMKTCIKKVGRGRWGVTIRQGWFNWLVHLTGCLLIFQPWFQGFQGRVLGFLGPFQGFQVRFLAKFRVLSPSRYKHFRPGANLGAHLTTFLAGLFTISDKKVRLKSLSLMYANFLRVLLNNICSWIIKNRADTIWDETNRTKLLFQMCQLS